MVRLAHASLWHWTQQQDCTRRNLGKGYWQLARVYALLRQADNARRYGQLCLAASVDDEPFYAGYAYEALARAEMVAGRRPDTEAFLASAGQLSFAVSAAEDRQALLNEIVSIRSGAEQGI